MKEQKVTTAVRSPGEEMGAGGACLRHGVYEGRGCPGCHADPRPDIERFAKSQATHLRMCGRYALQLEARIRELERSAP